MSTPVKTEGGKDFCDKSQHTVPSSAEGVRTIERTSIPSCLSRAVSRRLVSLAKKQQRRSLVVVAAQGDRHAAVSRNIGRVESENIFVLLISDVVDACKKPHIL